ncbi:hypothetical protein Hypma_001261 [Hypsizygus marmoreus]|uniref:Uncharacterized protein n=1 Tax=Hypsizygus marmoreus TaxID=39966 RepID=A0A369J6F3_HYPMA|nr:hypothetical protein Hypma_001261 [Hypsizygus marmoreus]
MTLLTGIKGQLNLTAPPGSSTESKVRTHWTPCSTWARLFNTSTVIPAASPPPPPPPIVISVTSMRGSLKEVYQATASK